MNKKDLSERDICTKYITPAILGSDWTQEQFREEVNLTDGRVLVQGNMATRVTNPEAKGGPKRADYVLYAQPHLPIAVLEAKRATYSVGHGMQQALLYAELLDAPFAISSNGESFLIHDRSGQSPETEWECSLENFPRLEDLWPLYLNYRGISQESVNTTIGQAYYSDSSGKESRYYQQVAINRTLEAISQGQERIMLVMATGTGKTYTAHQSWADRHDH